jgi:hypothetical protein
MGKGETAKQFILLPIRRWSSYTAGLAKKQIFSWNNLGQAFLFSNNPSLSADLAGNK